MEAENTIAQEVKQALTTSAEDIVLEQIQDEHESPLNQPVIEKDIGGEPIVENQQKNEQWNVWKPKTEGSVSEVPTEEAPNYREQVEKELLQEKQGEQLDAPEQQINGENSQPSEDIDDASMDAEESLQVPLAQANQAATALLGMTNNILAATGGYFVKIRKSKEFYEYDEIVSVIDGQNDKNLQRILLDKEDKALIKPLLASVLQKKAKKLTPEQQLLGAVASVMMKKAQVVMEIRAENSVLEDRILEIVNEHKNTTETPDAIAEDTISKEEAIPQKDMESKVYNYQESDKKDQDISSAEEYAEPPKTDS